MTAQVLETKN